MCFRKTKDFQKALLFIVWVGVSLPTVKKEVTLAIHKRIRGWLFGTIETSILECEQRGVRTSQGCKEAVIENLALPKTQLCWLIGPLILYIGFPLPADVNRALWGGGNTHSVKK